VTSRRAPARSGNAPAASIEQRARVLEAAYAARPERSVQSLPQPPKLPDAAWINPPDPEEVLNDR